MEKSGDRSTGGWSRVKALGSGAFGIVELWRNEGTGETRAIKKCQLSLSEMSSRQIERWKEEVAFMNLIDHRNIVGTRGIPPGVVHPSSQLPVLCMEYCRKGDLRDVLCRPENFWGLDEPEALRSMRDIASAVEYLHLKGITHRDLKPQNIVIQDHRSGTIYKLIDLGYAKELGEASAVASIVGTLNYVAPELFWKESYSSSVDYWSLGILFYEILTGTRPFLPNMAVNKHWLEHIKRKTPEHISARDILGKVEFSREIEDPSNVSKCLRDALTPWFRLVLQLESSRRGKILESGQSSVVVFQLLRGIFTKKILHLFIVSMYKRDNYFIEETTKISEVRAMIFQRENIDVNDQLLVSSRGKLLDDPQEKILSFLEEDEEVMVFEREKLLVGSPDADIPRDIQRMTEGGLNCCDYHTLRRYYGATVFFIKQQVELYKGYLIALSIKMDLISTNFAILAQKIEKIHSDSSLLQQSLQEILPLPGDGVSTSESASESPHQRELHKKIKNFLSSVQGMKNELKNLSEQKDKWIEIFSSTVDSTRLSDVLDEAVEVLREHLLSEQSKRRRPKRMMEIYFRFFRIRGEMLSSEGLKDVERNFLRFERELVKLERALESFEMILGQHQRDLQALRAPGKEPRPTGSGDDLVRDNIVLRHLINGLLTEMGDIKAKLGSLD